MHASVVRVQFDAFHASLLAQVTVSTVGGWMAVPRWLEVFAARLRSFIVGPLVP